MLSRFKYDKPHTVMVEVQDGLWLIKKKMWCELLQ